jgi:uncharacterized OB-fold protein
MRAADGAKWHCGECGRINWPSNQNCVKCYAPRR